MRLGRSVAKGPQEGSQNLESQARRSQARKLGQLGLSSLSLSSRQPRQSSPSPALMQPAATGRPRLMPTRCFLVQQGSVSKILEEDHHSVTQLLNHNAVCRTAGYTESSNYIRLVYPEKKEKKHNQIVYLQRSCSRTVELQKTSLEQVTACPGWFLSWAGTTSSLGERGRTGRTSV